jgi:hypothetical protein
VQTTAAITLSGEQTINGVAVVTGDRVLVKDQASSVDNGIYVADTSAWSRAPDFDGSLDAVDGTLVLVRAASGPDQLYELSATNPVIIGTSALVFSLSSLTATAFGALLVATADAAAARALLVVPSTAELQAQTYTAFTTAGTSTAYTLTTVPAAAALAENQRYQVEWHATSGATPTMARDGLTPRNIKVYDNTGAKVAPAVGALVAGVKNDVVDDGVDYVVLDPLPISTSQFADAPVNTNVTALEALAQFRGLKPTQAVISGPVDSNGFAAFGGSVGGVTLTTAATLRVAAAAGGDLSYVGSIVNPAFTSPAGSGTGYLMLSVTSAGVVTASVRTLLPAYQWGGTYGTTSGQFTHNIQEGTTKVGNGATADQVYEVCIGECPHTAGVWSGTIVWYAIKRTYMSPNTAWPAAGTAVSVNHNIGNSLCEAPVIEVVCLTAEQGFAIGDVIVPYTLSTGSNISPLIPRKTRLTAGFTTGSVGSLEALNATTGAIVALTPANWSYRITVGAGW